MSSKVKIYYLLFTRTKMEESKIVNNEITYTCTPGYEFFGFTKNKKLIREFKQLRNMNKFVIIERVVEDKEEELEFLDIISKRGDKDKELDIIEYNSKSGPIFIVSNLEEHYRCDTSESSWIMDELLESAYEFSSDIFQSKYSDALNSIGYDMFYRYNVYGEEFDDIFRTDEFSTLLYYYGELFEVGDDN